MSKQELQRRQHSGQQLTQLPFKGPAKPPENLQKRQDSGRQQVQRPRQEHDPNEPVYAHRNPYDNTPGR